MNSQEIEVYKGYNIVIEYDDMLESPREWDNITKMILFHRDYNFPNESKIPVNKDNFESWKEMADYIIKEKGALIINPVYMLDHSGIDISISDFNDPWDSGQVGFIYIDREGLKEMGIKKLTKKNRTKAEDILKGEFNIYRHYVSGEIYRYSIEKEVVATDPEGNTYNVTKFIDSCGGFYDYKEMLEDAKGIIDNLN